jgi:type VI secretion system secreted protein VgrG
MSQKYKILIDNEDVTTKTSAVHIIQSVSSHHRFEIHLATEDRSGKFKGSLTELSNKWIGKVFSVDSDSVRFNGIVTTISLSRLRGSSSEYIIRGNSTTILFEDGINTRSFGEKALKQIIDDVLKSGEGKFEVENKPKNRTLQYCVQNRESNFAFINRLAARYGEWFYYDGIKLIFGKQPNYKTIELSLLKDVNGFDLSIKTVPINFRLNVYDYKSHEIPESYSDYASENSSNQYAKIALKKSQKMYPNKSSTPINLTMSEDDLKDIVQLRQNTILSEMVFLNCTSTNSDLKLGSIIKLVDTRDELEANGTDDYGEYIIIQITHHFTAQGSIYTNHFEAIPKDTALPPLTVSPDPPPCEMQMAKVIENNDPKNLGRVRVEFIWQNPKESSANDAKSPWIRVASPYTGKDLGFYFIPEIGEQVLVAFDHNHPERPFVLSGMFNNEAKPAAFSKPDNHLKIIKTKGGNQISFNDEKGGERVVVTSPKTVRIIAQSGFIDIDAKGDIKIHSNSKSISISAAGDISMSASNISLNASNSITMKAKEITEKGEISVNIEAPKVDIEGKATAKLKAPMVEVDGSGMTIVKGGMLKLN